MALTNTELLAIGNERTGRSESQVDVDKFVKSFVHDLSIRGVWVEGEETKALVDSTPDYAESGLANSYNKILAITILDTNSKESSPLEEISWKKYKERVAQAVSDGKPSEYCRFKDTLYLWPQPDFALYPNMKVSGTIFHSDSTTIAFNERFRECASQYIIMKIYEKFGMTDKRKEYLATYRLERSALVSMQANQRISRQRYNDI